MLKVIGSSRQDEGQEDVYKEDMNQTSPPGARPSQLAVYYALCFQLVANGKNKEKNLLFAALLARISKLRRMIARAIQGIKPDAEDMIFIACERPEIRGIVVSEFGEKVQAVFDDYDVNPLKVWRLKRR